MFHVFGWAKALTFKGFLMFLKAFYCSTDKFLHPQEIMGFQEKAEFPIRCADGKFRWKWYIRKNGFWMRVFFTDENNNVGDLVHSDTISELNEYFDIKSPKFAKNLQSIAEIVDEDGKDGAFGIFDEEFDEEPEVSPRMEEEMQRWEDSCIHV